MPPSNSLHPVFASILSRHGMPQSDPDTADADALQRILLHRPEHTPQRTLPVVVPVALAAGVVVALVKLL